MLSPLRSALLVCGAACVAVLAWAGLAPIETRTGADREELFEIPRGTWAGRMSGRDLGILPDEIRLTLGIRDILVLRNLDEVADAEAQAVEGENLAKVKVANSDATRREREAEAEKLASAAEKVQAAKALEEAYVAEKKAEDARAERDRATQNATIVVAAQIQKEKAIIEAQAEAEKIREKARGEADAIFAKMEAEAKGMYEILTKQAEGLDRIVKAAGNNAKDAVLLLVSDKLPELVKMQTEAIKNIKIDKVTVWENGANGDGKNSTANFVSGLYKAVPPLKDIFDMAGMNLPAYLGETKNGETGLIDGGKQ